MILRKIIIILNIMWINWNVVKLSNTALNPEHHNPKGKWGIEVIVKLQTLHFEFWAVHYVNIYYFFYKFSFQTLFVFKVVSNTTKDYCIKHSQVKMNLTN